MIVEDEPEATSQNATQSDHPNQPAKRGQKKQPTQKQLERRRKNNEASRKSRAQKKDRFLLSVREVEDLRKENKKLKEFIRDLDAAIQESNDALMATFRQHISNTAANFFYQ